MISVSISDCCDSCDGHACDDTEPAPRLAVSVKAFGRRWDWLERRLLRWISKHVVINGSEPVKAQTEPRRIDGRRNPFHDWNG